MLDLDEVNSKLASLNIRYGLCGSLITEHFYIHTTDQDAFNWHSLLPGEYSLLWDFHTARSLGNRRLCMLIQADLLIVTKPVPFRSVE